MTRAVLLLTLALSALFASSANAAVVSAVENPSWPPRVDFKLTSDPCAEADCTMIARLTFRYRDTLVGRMNLSSPVQFTDKEWDSKPFDYADGLTSEAWYFWNCSTPGRHTWSAEIWVNERAADGSTTRRDLPAEGGSWNQPGCTGGGPRKVRAALARRKLTEDIVNFYPHRSVQSTSCAQPAPRKRRGSWNCRATWTAKGRTCTERYNLFFYTRTMFGRPRAMVVVGAPHSRRCSS